MEMGYSSKCFKYCIKNNNTYISVLGSKVWTIFKSLPEGLNAKPVSASILMDNSRSDASPVTLWAPRDSPLPQKSPLPPTKSRKSHTSSCSSPIRILRLNCSTVTEFCLLK